MRLISKNNKNLIGPTNDYVFKKIFGSIGNEKVTGDFIGNIIGRKIDFIDLNVNTNMEKNILSDKFCALDIKAILDYNTTCDIEMQIEDHNNFFERMLFYWSKIYSESLNEGEDYINLKKTISIMILNFEPEKLKSLSKFYSKWKILETECSNVVLTEHLEFHIISLRKLEKMIKEDKVNQDTMLVKWLKFLIEPDEIDESILEESEGIAMAKRELERFRMNEQERFIAELREKGRRDVLSWKNEAKVAKERALEDGLKQGIEQGIEQGLEQGLEQGIKQGIKQGEKNGISKGKKERNIEIAKKMLKSKMSIEDIMYLTDLTKEEIEDLM